MASGGYILSGGSDSGLTLTANPEYWAGKPAITTIELVGDLGGRGSVDAFSAGDVDYAPVFSIDATWLAYDETLGPQLRLVDSLSVQYYGFETSKPPFDDPRVRRAFGQAVDWRRMAALSSDDGTAQVANSMVPSGIPGRSDEDFLPPYDPDNARALLAEAGYPGGRGFPTTTLLTGGAGFDEAIVIELERELGVTLEPETMGAGYFDRLATDAPPMWALAWVADYPGRNDFLGVLLGTGASNNYGHWSSADVRCGDRGSRLSKRPRGRVGGLRSGRGHRARRRAGRPGRLRSRLGAVEDRFAGGQPERPRDHPDGGTGMGRVMPRRGPWPACLPWASCWPGSRRSRRSRLPGRRPSARRAPSPHSDRGSPSSSRSARTARSDGSSCS